MNAKSIEYTLSAHKREFKQEIITDSKSAQLYARNFYFDDISIYESVFIILMNNAGKTIGYSKISQGGVCQSVVDVRIVAKYAIESLSASIILVHNHPSGSLKPSREDINIAKRLTEALNIFGIKLLDSIIITEDGFTSMNDEGMM